MPKIKNQHSRSNNSLTDRQIVLKVELKLDLQMLIIFAVDSSLEYESCLKFFNVLELLILVIDKGLFVNKFPWSSYFFLI